MSVTTDVENMILYDQTCKQIWNMKTPSSMAGSVNPATSSPYQFINLIGGNRILSKAAANLCINQPSTSSGVIMAVGTCNGGLNQQWIYGMDKTIRSVNGGLCLDVKGGNLGAGTKVQQFACGSYKQNQMWNYNAAAGTLSPSYNINLCLATPATTVGSQLQLQTCNGGSTQQWNFN
jgi:hypothetical protein